MASPIQVRTEVRDAVGDHTIVVGAGVVGLATAYHLARRGARVTVLDAGAAGGSCSWGNAGWVVPQTTAPLNEPGIVGYAIKRMSHGSSPLHLRPGLDPAIYAWLWRFWRSCDQARFEAGRHALLTLGRDTLERFAELRGEADFTLNATESMRVFSTGEAARTAVRELERIAELGFAVDYDVIDGDEARLREPLLSHEVKAALVQRNELQVEPDTLTRALVEAVRSRGGAVVERLSASSLVTDRAGRVRAVRTVGGEVAGDRFVVAAGCWTPDLLRPLGVRLRIQAGKGYSVLVDLGSRPQRMIDLASAKCGIAPHRDGARIVGTMELSGRNTTVDRRRVDAMIVGAAPYLNAAARRALSSIERERVWVGARPMTSDGLPIIDRLGSGNLYVATGHAMMGVSLALSGGAALADWVLTGSRPQQLAPFAVHRHSTRQ